eukprot:1159067-Pelagomonas_calceolata.AAC.13
MADAVGVLYNATGEQRCYDASTSGPAAGSDLGTLLHLARCLSTSPVLPPKILVASNEINAFFFCLACRALGLSSVYRTGVLGCVGGLCVLSMLHGMPGTPVSAVHVKAHSTSLTSTQWEAKIMCILSNMNRCACVTVGREETKPFSSFISTRLHLHCMKGSGLAGSLVRGRESVCVSPVQSSCSHTLVLHGLTEMAQEQPYWPANGKTDMFWDQGGSRSYPICAVITNINCLQEWRFCKCCFDEVLASSLVREPLLIPRSQTWFSFPFPLPDACVLADVHFEHDLRHSSHKNVTSRLHGPYNFTAVSEHCMKAWGLRPDRAWPTVQFGGLQGGFLSSSSSAPGCPIENAGVKFATCLAPCLPQPEKETGMLVVCHHGI